MRRLLLVALALVLVPACGSEEGGDDEGAAPAGEVVDVALRDFTIDPPTIALDPGTYTFHVVNDGGTVHALEVEGPAGEVETSELEPGDSAELTVEVGEDGEFEMYCPVGDHKRSRHGGHDHGRRRAEAARRPTRRRPTRTAATATSS